MAGFCKYAYFDMSLLLLTVTLRGYLISSAYCLFLSRIIATLVTLFNQRINGPVKAHLISEQIKSWLQMTGGFLSTKLYLI